MNRCHELPPELRAAYLEGYELAKAGGWLDTLPNRNPDPDEEDEFARRSSLERIIAHQIGFIDGLKELRSKP